MRPHLLEVTAFGAFPGTVTVDFDGLASSGLFLLHGETGAGKSTLLDALGFALYGRVPGARGTARRLRSDHASAAARTEIRLEVTLGGRRLRVTRSPEQSRPKKRGDGVTSEPARVLLEELRAGAWSAVSTRAGEADQEIADGLGMSADQFWQVVLLPQGEFARFLRAPSEERGLLLERLFGTDRYSDVEGWLAERRRQTAAAVEAQQAEIRRLAHVVAQIAEIEPPDGLPGDLWAPDLTVQHAAAADVATRALAAAAEARSAAGGRAEATRALADRQARRAAAQKRERELAGAEPAVAALTAEAAAAAAAAEVAPLLSALAKAEAALDVAVEADARARERAARAGATPEDGVGELRAGARECEARVGRLADLAGIAAAADAEDRAAAAARTTADDLATHLARAAARSEELAGVHAAALAARDASRAAAEALPEAARRAEALRSAAAALLAGREADAEAAGLRVRHLEAREDAVRRHEAAQALRRERIDAMAAELAAKLVDGTPCPVCGSWEHPDPTEVSAAHVTREQEEGAAGAARRADAAAEAVGGRLAAALARTDELGSRLRELAEALGGELAPALVDRRWADHATAGAVARVEAARATDLRRRAERLTALDGELSGAAAAVADLQEMRAAAEEQHAAAARDATAAGARAEAHRAILRERLGGAPDLAAALAVAAEGAEARTAAAAAREELARTTDARDGAVRAAAEAAVAAGFDGPAAAAAATRTAAWRAQAAAEVQAHRSAVDGVRAVLASPDLDVPAMPPADVPAAEAAVVDTATAHDRAVAALARARQRSGQLERRVPELAAACAELTPLTLRADEVRALADLVAGLGANTRRMTLSAFVLAARLEEVATVASERLLRMTAGRYSLVHTDTGRGNRRAGLGLLARDAWTGRDRDTATLSGGETFLASLALALGLADVVCAEAGGTRLEALFVDEGFGSLDPDTLDEVMDVLDGLREGGRVVGLVSHVTELRQRIPAQLHVRKTPEGSSVSVVA